MICKAVPDALDKDSGENGYVALPDLLDMKLQIFMAIVFWQAKHCLPRLCLVQA